MRLKFACVLLLAVRCDALTAQTPSFAAALQETRSPLVLTDSGMSGAGGELLAREIAAARFVLVGESHFTREIPRFTAGLCRMMQPDAYAVEASPLAAAFVSGQIGSPKRDALMRARLGAYPASMAFLDMEDEVDAVAQCRASSRNPEFALWGLDQEFLGAGGVLLEAMRATGPGPQSMEALHRAQAEERTAEAKANASGDFTQLYLVSLPEAALDGLTTAIDADGTPETKRLLTELTRSRQIYGLNLAGSPESNHVRAQMLKQHFMSDYLPAREKMPNGRVLFKFGDMHMGRGFDTLHQLNLGNTVAELADIEGVRSLHVYVFGAEGLEESIQGYRRPLKQAPFDLINSKDQETSWLQPAMAELLPAEVSAKGTTLTIFDLRKLRFRKLELSPEWEQLVYSYDLMVVLPRVTPATPFVQDLSR